MTDTVREAEPTEGTFELVDADRRAEVGRNLEAPVPKVLGFLDQAGLWGNLGVSLLGFTGAVYVLQPYGSTPDMSLLAGMTAIIVGTVLGTLPTALAAIPGARTGAPAMVLLRGLFGGRASYLPTALNVAQCLGWASFELWTIASAATVIEPGLPHWAYVLAGGAISGTLAVFPLGFIRTLRRYVTVLVVLVLAFLLVEMLRQPMPAVGTGTWHGFWAATDTVIAVAISFAPLASDYSRHSRSTRAAFSGVVAGYGVTQVLCYGIGFMALLSVTKGSADPGTMYGAFKALPALGFFAMAILVTRELDQSFANVYSTAASLQNFGPRLDRRLLAAIVTIIATAGALGISTGTYENFLTLIGSVFVPLSAVMIVDWFITKKGSWDLSPRAPARWSPALAWAVGFVAYQMINPGYVGWWVHLWSRFDDAVGFQAQSWMSASIISFAAASVIALLRPRR